jgi:hypothetical protein
MTPFSSLARRLSESLGEVGYVPLDVWDGEIGGERHGVFDHTWISRHPDGRHCFASLFVSPTQADSAFSAEVWAALEKGTISPQTLVIRVDHVALDPDDDLESRLQFALLEAARRAEQMRSADKAQTDVTEDRAAARGLSIERVPYQLTVAATRELFAREPDREWRNRDVLRALLDQEFTTDRAAVNAALAELAWQGAIERVRRGRYRGRIQGD